VILHHITHYLTNYQRFTCSSHKRNSL